MGSSMSEQREAQLVEHFQRVVIMFDTDEVRRKAAVEIAVRLAHKLYARIVDAPEGKQPDQFSTVELHELLRAV
jgi:DNA primase